MIYLIHVFLINGMTNANILTNIWYLNWLIIVIISTIISMAADRIFPVKIKWIIGL